MTGLGNESLDLEGERAMILLAQRGDGEALEELLRISQPWVFNLVLRMVPDYHEAEDLSQEILLKTVLKLPSFRAESRFRTWLYRIAVNHVLSMKESLCERSFAESWDWSDDVLMRRFLAGEMPDPKGIPCDFELLVNEIRIKCMLGMLLCLNRRHRVVFILGSILEIGGAPASEILGVSEANFRKMLSRSRRRLLNFMKDCCGLVNPSKPCRCERCVPGSLLRGEVDPLKLVFGAKDAPSIREVLSQNRDRLDNIELRRCRDLYREHPFQSPPDLAKKVLELLQGADCQGFLDALPLR
jgi:RNA polymerase sigma factor (sigma-70 family)